VTTATLFVTTSGATSGATPGGPLEIVIEPLKSCLIGRSIEADMLIDDARVSRRHLLIEPEAQGWRIRDVSSNGSWHNGDPIDANGLLLSAAGTQRIFLGDPDGPEVAITYRAAVEPPAFVAPPSEPSFGPGTMLRRRTDLSPSDPNRDAGLDGATQLQHHQQAAHDLVVGRITVGRDPRSDVHLPDLLVSRNHAELRIAHNEAEIVDLGSANGTFVNGQRVTQAPVYDGDVITIGHYLLQVEGSRLVEFVDTGDVSFEAEELAVFAGQKQLMHDVSFQLPARTLLAVVGRFGNCLVRRA